MEKQIAPILYTEARLSLDQRYAGSTVELAVPASNSSTFSAQRPPRRALISDIQIGSDELTFSKKHVATEASIYFRTIHRSPRCFLWRLLDDRRALEIQAVDLTQEGDEKPDPQLTILLRFPAEIRPFGIALAEPAEKDALTVFALTTADTLFTITLHREYFISERATENPVIDWCRIYAPSTLKLQRPFRLIAINSQELFITLVDDSILKLSRNNHEDGTHWRESIYTGSSALQSMSKSLRSKLPWQTSGNTIDFGVEKLEGTVAVDIAISPDGDHIFALCLDGILRVWAVHTGKIVGEADVSGVKGQSQLASKRLISPTQKHILRVVNALGLAGDLYYIVTFAPDSRRFRFWGVIDDRIAADTFREVHQDAALIPPIDELMDTSIWNLEEFHVVPRKSWKETCLWIRVVSGTVSRVFTLVFNLFGDSEDVAESWKSQWKVVSDGYQTSYQLGLHAPRSLHDDDGIMHNISLNDVWLDFLLFPGRFTASTLETALSVFIRGKRLSVGSHGTIKYRLTQAIEADVTSNAQSDSTMDPGRFQAALSESWQHLFGLVKDLQRRRCELLSLVLDPEEQLPWLVCSDSVSPIRICSALEVCDLNKSRFNLQQNTLPIVTAEKEPSKTETLLNLAHTVHSSVSTSLRQKFEQALNEDLFVESSDLPLARLEALAYACEMRDNISDDEFTRLNDVMDELDAQALFSAGTFDDVSNLMNEEVKHGHSINNEAMTAFGARALVRVASETVELNTRVLLDLAFLLVFAVVEVGPDEPSTASETAKQFPGIVEALRANYAFRFLLTNVREDGRSKRSRGMLSGDSPTASRLSTSERNDRSYTSTLLEAMFSGGFWKSLVEPLTMQLDEAITYWGRRWLSSLVDGGQFPVFATHVLADLVKHTELDYALKFLPFVALEPTPWGLYVQGRLYLAVEKLEDAAKCFKKSSYAICKFFGLSFG